MRLLSHVTDINKGDLVACYILNSSLEQEALLQYGIVLEVNPHVEDLLVLDNNGDTRWWPQKRWRLLKKKKKK